MMDKINIMAFFLGILSLVLTIKYGNDGRKSYRLLINNFEQKVMDILMSLCEADGLTGAPQLKGTIKNISTEYNVDMPSDQHIVMTLRRIALKYQQQDPGTQKTKKILRKLEQIRQELEPKGLPLASIASVNRMTAFLIIVGALVVFFLFLLAFNIMRSGPVWLTVSATLGEIILTALMFSIRSRIRSGLENNPEHS